MIRQEYLAKSLIIWTWGAPSLSPQLALLLSWAGATTENHDFWNTFDCWDIFEQIYSCLDCLEISLLDRNRRCVSWLVLFFKSISYPKVNHQFLSGYVYNDYGNVPKSSKLDLSLFLLLMTKTLLLGVIIIVVIIWHCARRPLILTLLMENVEQRRRQPQLRKGMWNLFI